MSDDMTMMMGMSMSLIGILGIASSAGMYIYRDHLCSNYKVFSFLCPTPTNPPVIVTTAATEAATTAAASASGTSGTGYGKPSTVIGKRFSPYVLLSNSSLKLVGAKHKWTTLAFVVGYTNGKIQWDSGNVDTAALKNKIAAAKKIGGGVIVSFGGQSAGTRNSKYRSELAGKYTNPSALADAYEKIADSLDTTWLDFDVEEEAVKDTAANDRRNKALYLLQKRRNDIRISYTVPVEMKGLSTATKNMLSKSKKDGVRIDVVNIMTMYFTNSKTTMSTAVNTAVKAAKPFITSLGAKVGITPQIGKNPDAPYKHENFTTGDATRIVSTYQSDSDVALLSFWSLNNDDAKFNGAYTTAFTKF